MVQIWIPASNDLMAPKQAEFRAKGTCRKCGQPYVWSVGSIWGLGHPDENVASEKAEGLAHWEEWRKKGIGPCCVPPEVRRRIIKASGNVLYGG